MLITTRLAFLSLIGMVWLLGADTAFGQDYPNRPIRLIVPNSPGAAVDTLPRIFAPEMAKILGQPIVVENKPGADSIIGYEYVAKQAPADGYTLLIGNPGNFAVLPLTKKDLRFDPRKDLPPVMGLTETTLVLASPTAAPWKTFNEMVVYVKSNPGKTFYGDAGVFSYLLMEGLLADLGGLKITRVPYGATQANFTDLVAGRTQLAWMPDGLASSMGNPLKPGEERRLRALAVTGDERSTVFPDSPTFRELGVPKVMGSIVSLNVRAGTPKPVIDKLYTALAQALRDPQVKDLLAKAQLNVVIKTPEATAQRTAEMSAYFADAALRIGLKPE